MKRYRILLLSVLIGAVISGFLREVFVMPEFTLLAMPGIFFSMAVANNAHAFSLVLVFVGNWIFYSAVVGLLLVIARKVRAHRYG